MKTYLFDVTIQGMVIADTAEDAKRYILGIGWHEIYIDIDDFVNLKLQELDPKTPQEVNRCKSLDTA